MPNKKHKYSDNCICNNCSDEWNKALFEGLRKDDIRIFRLIKKKFEEIHKLNNKDYTFEVHPNKGKNFYKDVMIASDVVGFLLRFVTEKSISTSIR